MGEPVAPYRDPAPGWAALLEERRAAWSDAVVGLGGAREVIAERMGRAAKGAVILAIAVPAIGFVVCDLWFRSWTHASLAVMLVGAPLAIALARGIGRVAGAAWIARRLRAPRRLDVGAQLAFHARDPRAIVAAAAARIEGPALWLELVAAATWLPVVALHFAAAAVLCWLVTEPLAVLPGFVALLLGGFAVVGGWIWPFLLVHAALVVRGRGRPARASLVIAWISVVLVALVGPAALLGDELGAFFLTLSALAQIGIYAAVVARAGKRLAGERLLLAAR